MGTLDKVYNNCRGSLDGRILNVVSGDLGDAATRYTYFDLYRAGFNIFTLQWIITATTITIEACNMNSDIGTTVTGTATSTDGTGATIVCTTLNSSDGFATDDDLIGAKVKITSDSTTTTNVGATRTVTDYAQATGTLTLSSAIGATTSGVTSFQIEDAGEPWGRRASDPDSTQWIDITTAITGSANFTATNAHIQDTPLSFERLRIKRLTTNATNALALRLTRGVS